MGFLKLRGSKHNICIRVSSAASHRLQQSLFPPCPPTASRAVLRRPAGSLGCSQGLGPSDNSTYSVPEFVRPWRDYQLAINNGKLEGEGGCEGGTLRHSVSGKDTGNALHNTLFLVSSPWETLSSWKPLTAGKV